MKITYKWKELSEDGLLKEPQKRHSYDNYSINGFDGFDSVEDAEIALQRWNLDKENRFSKLSGLVLVKIYL